MGVEKFDIKKFLAGINPFNLIGWSKALNNLTHFVILAVIIFGTVYGIGYWKGLKNRPVSVAETEDRTPKAEMMTIIKNKISTQRLFLINTFQMLDFSAQI